MKKAGTVILGISILLWAMMTYPGLPDAQRAEFDLMRKQVAAIQQTEDSPELLKIDSLEAEAGLRNSFAGRIGLALEPVSRYAGIDWRTNIALAGGFAAKEVIVSTLGTAYSLGDVQQNTTSLRQRLVNDPHWSPVSALAVLAFIMFYAPCFVTIVAIAGEAGSWKWAFFSMGFNTLFAFLLSTAIYQIGTLLGLG
jgi:ferrous iron transport protein B